MTAIDSLLSFTKGSPLFFLLAVCISCSVHKLRDGGNRSDWSSCHDPGYMTYWCQTPYALQLDWEESFYLTDPMWKILTWDISISLRELFSNLYFTILMNIYQTMLCHCSRWNISVLLGRDEKVEPLCQNRYRMTYFRLHFDLLEGEWGIKTFKSNLQIQHMWIILCRHGYIISNNIASYLNARMCTLWIMCFKESN